MSEPFIAEIRIFAGNFAPRGWAFCNGQLLPVAQNTALFSLIGTTYGGDGRTTFGLPDIVVNNAGITHLPQALDYVTEDDFDRVFAVADEDLERADEEKSSAVHFLRFDTQCRDWPCL